jgi:hypothetical protein
MQFSFYAKPPFIFTKVKTGVQPAKRHRKATAATRELDKLKPDEVRPHNGEDCVNLQSRGLNRTRRSIT